MLFVLVHINDLLRHNHQKIYGLAVYMFILHVRTFIWFPGRRKLISAQVYAEDMLLTLHDMNSCLSCIPFKPSSPPPADCQTCMNKAKSEGGTVMQSSQGMNSSLCGLSWLLHSFLLFSPSLLLLCYGWNQMIKHRLQRLLRPQKEERKSKPQTSTVATVGLEEMKTKVQNIL